MFQAGFFALLVFNSFKNPSDVNKQVCENLNFKMAKKIGGLTEKVSKG